MFVALRGGALGILTEIETIYVAPTESDPAPMDPGDLRLIESELREQLAPAARQFPGAQVMLARGYMTFEGCLCVSDFTPLTLEIRDGKPYTSLPGDQKLPAHLDDALNALLFL